MKLQKVALALLVPSVLAGCATQGGTAVTGGGIGAGIGAGLGALIGDSSKAAGIGAGIGALTGSIVGYNWNKIIGKVDQAGGKQLGVSTTKLDNGALKVNIPESATFNSSEYQLKPAIYPVLDALATSVNETPQLRVKVIGHTDSSGNVGINQPLSENRARSVVNYLTSKGVFGRRITSEGRAATDPIADNSTAEGRRQNRRVEVYLYAVGQ